MGWFNLVGESLFIIIGVVDQFIVNCLIPDPCFQVHPDKPLYSLGLLVPALKKRFQLALSTHCHSSVKQPGTSYINKAAL